MTSRDTAITIPTISTDQIFDNCFPDQTVNPLTGKVGIDLRKRLGSSLAGNVQTGATGSYGYILWTGSGAATPPTALSYVKTGGTSTMFFNGVTQIGADIPATNACLYLDETTINVSSAHLTATLNTTTNVLVPYYFPEGGAWTAVTSAPLATSSLPICADHCHMDGFQFVMRKDGKIFHSEVNTVSSWPAANFVTANSFADKGIALTRYKNLVVGFGDYSTEFFYNAGNASGSVLSRVKNADIRIGCKRRDDTAGRVCMAVGDTIYWLGLNPESGVQGVYRLRGMAAEKVSIEIIDLLLNRNRITFIVGAFQMFGMTHIAFGRVDEASKMCYCVERNFWWRYISGNALHITGFAADGASPAQSRFNASNSAGVYLHAAPATPLWQDSGSTYALSVQTANVDLDTDRKKVWRKLRIAYDRQPAASPITVSASDNDHASYSTLGSIDTVSSNAMSWINRLGTSRRRSWKFEHSANTACRIAAVEIDYDVGNP